MHLESGCQMLACNEYLKKHTNVLKVLMTTWAVKTELQDKSQCWYKLKLEQGMFIESTRVKLY